MTIIDYIAKLLMFISIIFHIEYIGLTIICVYALIEVMAVIRSIIYSKKEFVCLECGKKFDLKWTDLVANYRNWGYTNSREIVIFNEVAYKRIGVHCEKCGAKVVGYRNKENKP